MARSEGMHQATSLERAKHQCTGGVDGIALLLSDAMQHLADRRCELFHRAGGDRPLRCSAHVDPPMPLAKSCRAASRSRSPPPGASGLIKIS